MSPSRIAVRISGLSASNSSKLKETHSVDSSRPRLVPAGIETQAAIGRLGESPILDGLLLQRHGQFRNTRPEIKIGRRVLAAG